MIKLGSCGKARPSCTDKKAENFLTWKRAWVSLVVSFFWENIRQILGALGTEEREKEKTFYGWGMVGKWPVETCRGIHSKTDPLVLVTLGSSRKKGPV